MIISKELKKYRDYPHLCLTENSDGLSIPSVKLPKRYKKVWGKLYLFKVATEGKNIFFDIDNIIHDDPFKILDNLTFKKLTIIHQPWKDKLFYRQHSYDTNICSQVMGWENDLSYIYCNYVEKKRKILIDDFNFCTRALLHPPPFLGFLASLFPFCS